MKTITPKMDFEGVPDTSAAPTTNTQQSGVPTRLKVAGSLGSIPGQASRPRSERAEAFRPLIRPVDPNQLLSAASTVSDIKGLKVFCEDFAASVEASAGSPTDRLLDAHYTAFEEVADRVLQWPWPSQVDAIRALSKARSEIPVGIGRKGESRLNTALKNTYETAINARTELLASQIDSPESLEEVLRDAETDDRLHSRSDPLRDLVYESFLDAVLRRIENFERNELARCHPIISAKIVSPPPGISNWATASADKKLSALAASRLLPPHIEASYQESEELASAAESVRDLTELHALLSKSGIAGPKPYDDLPGEHDGNMGLLPGRPCAQPLAELGNRVGSFTPLEANFPAFSAIIEKTDTVEPAALRVGPLESLALAAGRLTTDAERGQGYQRLLTSFDKLVVSRRATSEQCASVLASLHEAITERMQTNAGPAERAALTQLGEANKKLPPGYQLAL